MSPDASRLATVAPLREDLKLVADMVAPGSRLLDVGCGNGELLFYLLHAKGVDGRGMELSQGGVNSCVRNGLSVIQGDAADSRPARLPLARFRLHRARAATLQATRNPREVLHHLVRIGRHAIVSIPNFGHWRMRARLLLQGRMPRTAALPHHWYDTPNIHLCTILDFIELCDEENIAVERSVTLDDLGRPYRLNPRGRICESGGGAGAIPCCGDGADIILRPRRCANRNDGAILSWARGIMMLRIAGLIFAAVFLVVAATPLRAAQYLAPIDQQRSYSSGVVTQGGKTIWLAGEGGVTGPGGKKNTDLASQTRQIFENIAAALKEAGGSLDNVVTMTVMIRNQSDGPEFLRLRGEYFKKHYPASMLIVAKDFANPNLLLEVQGGCGHRRPSEVASYFHSSFV